jgi:hypothetical protein
VAAMMRISLTDPRLSQGERRFLRDVAEKLKQPPRQPLPEGYARTTVADGVTGGSPMPREGSYPRGERHPGHKLTQAQVEWIRKTREVSTIIAKKLGIDDSHVRAIRRGCKWEWLREAARPPLAGGFQVEMLAGSQRRKILTRIVT